MIRGYNFYNLEASFRHFLTAGNKKMSSASIKNYLSDLRHFLGWLVLAVKSKSTDALELDSDNIFQYLTKEVIAQYKAYLSKNDIPIKTINRRLSTLRKFCSFCISQRWIDSNPAKQIHNISSQIIKPGEEIENDLALEQYKESLLNSGLDQKEALKELENIKEFLAL
ncbi:hypothetical protein A3G67_02370 [Candidatus Roizmanbacteria bacterium RIFCSPLOWO2_12_FULL_40_12]|uniref:Core-binding (CB) domain-containing protein n=1 Tax=Candidatus Roizmanbacteria bacterium RIFCSPLOWO2_01_FULL_40_42 TaxID=1802066 RepID=A0A1F7J418_9BACT|nr:MAG: hypothetical protein A2779_04920 [Candidatus Roizmanbacteria bacterium RIFCSPHIGHO2_01_FULL_40_98]OGK28453.1 MAG: hypothetical protein A3C31_01265 [Candidatus Roizmanbacteria bacterium RIFCSPHIGHO2_02_FULL_40_53]OGK29491.1 MAG: hypothetical protein A2W49_00255 [Candidatus Roizmanbacteria bacterium RIFCSPHIGHO2_12_41_18]OGK36530.1 MAG: hypothetical protein A3E69_03740 [Candidatus Roizmanbacteria bacterium RIFCSPHIGHO2_12_FULL_40_130]OGK50345.1 MAG: hypothetical protein A3B50_02980 [Candi